MLYKTIVLELLTQRRELHEQLRRQRRLPVTLEACSLALKARHRAWIQTLATANPASDQIQIQSEAMERAIRELENRLSAAFPAVSPGGDPQPLSLDAAIAFIRCHTRRG